ncbi:uncharacterized protein B4U80_09663, partial [Leptotrombidium deliense]
NQWNEIFGDEIRIISCSLLLRPTLISNNISICFLVNSLALNSIQIPGAVENGSKIWLQCDFEILTNSTFSVKWYRNDVEFFRLDVTKKDVDIESEGTYSCEVSNSEFISAKLSSDLRVYVLSKEKLKLIGVKESYSSGDLVDICCVSGFTKPATILAWFVNGNRVSLFIERHCLTFEKFTMSPYYMLVV